MLNVFVDGNGQPQYVPVGNIKDLRSIDASAIGGIAVEDLEKAHDRQVSDRPLVCCSCARGLPKACVHSNTRLNPCGAACPDPCCCVRAGQAAVCLPQRGRRRTARRCACRDWQGVPVGLAQTPALMETHARKTADFIEDAFGRLSTLFGTTGWHSAAAAHAGGGRAAAAGEEAVVAFQEPVRWWWQIQAGLIRELDWGCTAVWLGCLVILFSASQPSANSGL